MSFEVEIKYQVTDHEAIAARLTAIGAIETASLDQEDTYLAHPARDFAQTHEALRLRREGSENRITYKGPKLAGPTKTREEIELPLGSGAETLSGMLRLFEILGFRLVAVVRKSRRSFPLQFENRSMHVTLDVAQGLGTFVEVETIADGPDDLPGAQSAVIALAQLLGLADDQIQPRSYLRMLLDLAETDAKI